MALASLVSKQKGQNLLKNLIEQELVSQSVLQPMTAESKIRASGIYSMCPREEVLASLLNHPRGQKVDAALSLIFAHGNALHHQLQNDILPRIGVLVGQWRCNWCMKKHGGWKKGIPPERTLIHRPKACRRCKKSDFTYNELHFEDPNLRISGHPDGFLQIPGLPGIGILEGKSIGARGGIEIKKAPNIAHVYQAQVYMDLTGLRWAKILYWQKAESGLNALVEHLVEYDEETVKAIREMVQSIWIGLKTGDLPDRICANSTCARAKECSLVGPCFDSDKRLKHDPTDD